MQQYDPLYFAVHGRRVVLAHGLGHGEHLDLTVRAPKAMEI